MNCLGWIRDSSIQDLVDWLARGWADNRFDHYYLVALNKQVPFSFEPWTLADMMMGDYRLYIFIPVPQEWDWYSVRVRPPRQPWDALSPWKEKERWELRELARLREIGELE